jgi:hypothetical protein
MDSGVGWFLPSLTTPAAPLFAISATFSWCIFRRFRVTDQFVESLTVDNVLKVLCAGRRWVESDFPACI